MPGRPGAVGRGPGTRGRGVEPGAEGGRSVPGPGPGLGAGWVEPAGPGGAARGQ